MSRRDLSALRVAQTCARACSRRPCRHHLVACSGRLFLQPDIRRRSEEHTSELQSLMRISYAVFCLKKKKKNKPNITDVRYNEQEKKNNHTSMNNIHTN